MIGKKSMVVQVPLDVGPVTERYDSPHLRYACSHRRAYRKGVSVWLFRRPIQLPAVAAFSVLDHLFDRLGQAAGAGFGAAITEDAYQVRTTLSRRHDLPALASQRVLRQ